MVSATTSTEASRLLEILSASAIAGMASTTANAITRSFTLLLRKVRISTCLPSQFPYTSASLCPSLSLSSLFIGSKFHGFGRLLPCSNYRLSGMEGRALCQVAIYLEDMHTPGVCQVARCSMHIVTTGGTRVVPSRLCQASYVLVRRLQRPVSSCSRTVAPFPLIHRS